MKKIADLLIDKYDNHIMPFLWTHGEGEAVIRAYVEKIAQSGIRSLCFESRPHEDFLKEKWWHDMDILLDECEKRDMTVWILDDQHFPTGYAAGEIAKNHKNLQKEFLNFHQFDFNGPRKNAGIVLDWTTMGNRPNVLNVGVDERVAEKGKTVQSEIVSIVAARKKEFNEIEAAELRDLTDLIKGDTLYWDIPSGEWSVFVFYTTQEGGEASTEGYLNPLVPEATDVLLNTVYEAHYAHYKESFGTTIRGFFSDEPRFGNIKGPDAVVGKIDMPLPWRPGFLAMFAERLHKNIAETKMLLPLLYRGDSDKAHEVRYQYMELVTDLYSEHFSKRIGNWCTNHRVEHIGHVIEDNNAHARLGYGAGHFFKSMAGQDMAGIDVVLHQLLPQENNGYFKAMTSTGWDGEFFHYALAKMGASLGHLDPKKRGQTMCEMYGAYGWSEGTKLMKWLTDHMLVRGVNNFVPHAFSMKEYPDPDCPPHFYAHGQNPEFAGFGILMEYMNRVSYLFSEGKHKGDVAVLYHAEAEWSGDYMPFQKVARVLLEKQIEFDIVSSQMVQDSFLEAAHFTINQQEFTTLIIPFSQRLPQKLLKKLEKLAENGVRLIFMKELVHKASEGVDASSELTAIGKKAEITNVDELFGILQDSAIDRLVTNIELPFLRYYHYELEGKSVFMLFNENDVQDIQFNAIFPVTHLVKGYNPLENTVKALSLHDDHYEISLAKSESLIVFETDLPREAGQRIQEKWEDVEDLQHNHWQVLFDGVGIEAQQREKEYSALPVIGVGDDYGHFSGTTTYLTETGKHPENTLLEIENASEIVSVSINGHLIGTKISTPYTFDLSGSLNEAKNEIKIEVINNLGRNKRDYLSQYLLVEPIGITGSVKLKANKEEKK